MNSKYTKSLCIELDNSAINLYVTDDKDIQIKLRLPEGVTFSDGISLTLLMESIAKLWSQNDLGKIQVVLTESVIIVP